MSAPVGLELSQGIATVTLDRGQRANALAADLVAALEKTLDDALVADPVALVLRARGRAFCGGFDLSDLDTVDHAVLIERFTAVERLLQRVRSAPCLTIAVVDGPAIGAGADLVAACDYRIGSAHARFRFPGVRFGLLLGTAHLVRLVGGQAARDLLVAGCTVAGADAHRMGLLSHLVEGETADALIVELSRRAAGLPLPTLRSVLAITRGEVSADSMTLVRESASDPRLSERIRQYDAAEAARRGGGEPRSHEPSADQPRARTMPRGEETHR